MHQSSDNLTSASNSPVHQPSYLLPCYTCNCPKLLYWEGWQVIFEIVDWVVCSLEILLKHDWTFNTNIWWLKADFTSFQYKRIISKTLFQIHFSKIAFCFYLLLYPIMLSRVLERRRLGHFGGRRNVKTFHIWVLSVILLLAAIMWQFGQKKIWKHKEISIF